MSQTQSGNAKQNTSAGSYTASIYSSYSPRQDDNTIPIDLGKAGQKLEEALQKAETKKFEKEHHKVGKELEKARNEKNSEEEVKLEERLARLGDAQENRPVKLCLLVQIPPFGGGQAEYLYGNQDGQTMLDERARKEYSFLDEPLKTAFFVKREELRNKKLAFLIDSPGGSPKAAYQLAKFLRRYNGGYIAVIPRRAKSAATLFTLGADKIYIGTDAELGPLDARYRSNDPDDPEFQKDIGVIDEVKVVERAHASALDAMDLAMALLVSRTRKKVEDLLPTAKDIAVELARPLMQQMQVKRHTQMSRVLKISEDYASRLLEYHFSNYSDQYSNGSGFSNAALEAEGTHIVDSESVEISIGADTSANRRNRGQVYAQLLAKHLVGAYADHDFAIDVDEARALGGIGLPTVANPEEVSSLQKEIDEIHRLLLDYRHDGLIAVGTVQRLTIGAVQTNRAEARDRNGA